MKNHSSVTVLFFICFIILIVPSFANSFPVYRGERPSIDISNLPEDSYEPGKLSVKFSREMRDNIKKQPARYNAEGIIQMGHPALDEINVKYRIMNYTPMLKDIYVLSKNSERYFKRHQAWGLDCWYEIQLDKNTDIREAVLVLMELPEVEIAEPVYRKRLIEPVQPEDTYYRSPNKTSVTPHSWSSNDPLLEDQWHYHNTGQNDGTPGKDIRLFQAWEIEKGNSDVIVAVIDQGVDFNHPDIAANMWSSIGPEGSSTVPGNHGTHVAGTVAAVTNNALGVAGIAGGSGTGDGVRIMTLDLWNNSGLTPLYLFTYAADQGASISQNSWGYTNPGVYEQSVLDAIDYFNAIGGGNALSGGVTFFAAGNDDDNGAWYPGFYSGAFSVAATNNHDQKSWYSNYGNWIDISAPGGETFYQNDPRGVLSTLNNGEYGFYQGTSMACPHVSGVAALIISLAYGELTAEDLKDILLGSADNHYAQNPSYIGQLGSGRLNAYAALLEAQSYMSGIQAPSNFQATPISETQINLSWEKNDELNDVLILWSPDNIFDIPQNGVEYSAGESLPDGGTVLYSGSALQYEHEDLDASTVYYYRAFSFDSNYEYSHGRNTNARTLYGTFMLPFFDGFETGSIEPYWTQEGTPQWTVYHGGLNANPSAPYEGNWNIIMYDSSTSSNRNKLITPDLDMGNHTNVQLTFWHAQVPWAGDQDELRIYYRTSPSSSWVLLESYTNSVNIWTQRTLNLPNPTQNYAVAFEGDARWGYGVCIDNVLISALDNLSLSPSDGLLAEGIEGGPFVPDTKNYTLTNSGTETLDWTAEVTQSWIELSSAGGTLSEGASTEVTVSLTSEANLLTPGIYQDIITFTNVSTDHTHNFDIELTVLPMPGTIQVVDSIPPEDDLVMPFGPVSIGESRTEQVTVSNSDAAYDLLLSNIFLGSAYYFEDFESGEAPGWEPSVPSQWSVVSGEYRASDSSQNFRMQATYSGQIWADGAFQATMRRTGSANSAAVFIARATEDFNWQNQTGSAYLVGISESIGYYVLYYLNGTTNWLQSWTSSPHLNTDGSSNTVVLNLEGNTIQVYFNGHLTWSGTDNNVIEAGRVGLMGYTASANPTVHFFDNVQVGEPIESSAAVVSEEQEWYNASPYTEDFTPWQAPLVKGIELYEGKRTAPEKNGIIDVLSAGSFRLQNVPALPITLSPGESVTFDVIFEPSSAGTVEDTLNIESNDGDNPLVEVSLSGSGIQVDFSADPLSGSAPLSVQFTDESQGNFDSWLWDFGDDNTSTAQNPTHIYTAEGVYTVSLTASGPDGSGTETKEDYITVAVVPEAAFSASKTNVVTDEVIEFTDESTGDITSWFWDFGDSSTSSDQNPEHAYTEAGTYTVSLTVTGPVGSDTEIKEDYLTICKGIMLFLPDNVQMPLVSIPYGSFMMGRYPGEQDSNTNEDPQHEVTIGSISQVMCSKVWEEACGMLLVEKGSETVPEGAFQDYFRGLAVYDDYLLVVNRYVPEVKFYSVSDGSERLDLSLSLNGIQEDNFGLLRVQFSEEGALYGANLVIEDEDPSSDSVLHGNFKVYRWDNIDADPEMIYEMDFSETGRMRLGDALNVRGTGDDTKILVSGNRDDTRPILIEKVEGLWQGTILPNPVRAQDLYLNEDGSFWRSAYSSSIPFQKYDPTGVPIPGSAINLELAYEPPAITAFTIDEDKELIYTIGLRENTVGTVTYQNQRIVTWDFSGKKIAESEPFAFDPEPGGNWNGTGSLQLDADGNVYALLERHGVARFDVTAWSELNLGKFAVTKAQWEAVMGTTPWEGEDYVLDDPDSPAVYVSWNDIANEGGFLETLNVHLASTGQPYEVRLPSEAEWEYAARAGTTTRFYWGDDTDYTEIDDYAWYGLWGTEEAYAHIVGQKIPNDWGLYDMAGNIWEWCEDDWHDNYNEAPNDGSAWVDTPRGSSRVARGGSWNATAGYCRSAYRGWITPDLRADSLGFRLLAVQREIELDIEPVSRHHGASSETGIVSVYTELTWQADAQADWITIISADSGTGNGSIEYSITENTGTERQSEIMFSGGDTIRTFTVYQTAAPPVADFSADQTIAEVHTEITFTDASSGGIDTWFWNFGDGSTSSDQNPEHAYTEAGTYTVSLTVTGPAGSDTETKEDYITVVIMPEAAFCANKTLVALDEAVLFTDQSIGNITSWFWTFGDTATSSDQHPEHIYTEAGTYTVSLTVTGPNGSDTITRQNYIRVTDEGKFSFSDDFDGEDPGWTEYFVAPDSLGENNHRLEREVTAADIQAFFPDFVSPAGSNGKFLVMEANAYDEERQCVALVLEDEAMNGMDIVIEWKMNLLHRISLSEFAGVAARATDFHTSIEGTPDIPFIDSGYLFRVRTDYSETFGSYAGLKKVKDSVRGPEGKWILFEEGSQGEGVNWNSTLININPDPQGEPIRVEGLWVTYRMEIIAGEAVHYYINDMPVYTLYDEEYDTGKIYLFLWDQWASTTFDHNAIIAVVDYFTVQELKEAPSAEFLAEPLSGTEPLTVQFTDESTGDITTWSWDFGDGAVSSDQHPDHTYTEAGTYTVSLTVTGPGGSNTEIKEDYITVDAAFETPIALFSANKTDVETAEIIEFTDESTGDITTWSWDFGDGATSSEQHPDHAYTEAGTYTVSLTVTGPAGSDTDTRENYIIVTEAEQQISISNFEDLQKIGGYPEYPLDGHYILTHDIDASVSIDLNNGQGFNPIGDNSNPFTGTFNGQGYIISGLVINRPHENYVGLIGFSGAGSQVQRIGLSGGSIEGDTYTGGLVGYNYEGTISNSYSTVSVTGQNYVGGLVGYNDEGSILNSYTTGFVNGNFNAGGLIGWNVGSGTILSSYWDIDTTQQAGSAGGEGRSTQDMTYPYNENTYVDWNFTDIWNDDVEYEENDGYPVLQAIPTSITDWSIY